MDECANVEGEEQRRLWCRGEVYFAVGIENGEYSGVLLSVPGGVGWVG